MGFGIVWALLAVIALLLAREAEPGRDQTGQTIAGMSCEPNGGCPVPTLSGPPWLRASDGPWDRGDNRATRPARRETTTTRVISGALMSPAPRVTLLCQAMRGRFVTYDN
jgi:hypothetical protein